MTDSEDRQGQSTRTTLETGRHDLPVSAALAELMRMGWDDAGPPRPAPVGPAESCAMRRQRLSALLPGERIVVPAGRPVVRGNGQDYRYRPASDYVYLTGDDSAESVLVLEPDGDGHTARLYVRPPDGRATDTFFTDHLNGELWVGRRPALDDYAAALGVECRPLDELAGALGAGGDTRLRRGLDPVVDAQVAEPDDTYPEGELRAILSELRLVKDAWEIEQIEEAVATTIVGFEEVARVLPAALADGGERRIEAVFTACAVAAGNGPAFHPIAAAGTHATTLHWRRNDGVLRAGELLLLDAGAESRTLYAADLTRTYPLGERYSDTQRRMLHIVNDAIDAALAAITPGRPFRDFHRAVATSLATGLADWGLLSVSAEESLGDDSGLHRRYTLCAPGHMLGLDVHDCAHARAASYLDGELRVGHVLTVEPGLYFQPDDLSLPAELRGIGVRAEEDVVVTEDGCRVLSERLPRRADEVEAWIQSLRQTE